MDFDTEKYFALKGAIMVALHDVAARLDDGSIEFEDAFANALREIAA